MRPCARSAVPRTYALTDSERTITIDRVAGVLAGPSGTGKTHYLEGLAGAAIEAGLRVAWFSLESLTATIGRSKVDGSTSRVVARICRSELIVVDDIGMLPGQEAAEAFYRVVILVKPSYGETILNSL
jgi:DNA replication protein DnaC